MVWKKIKNELSVYRAKSLILLFIFFFSFVLFSNSIWDAITIFLPTEVADTLFRLDNWRILKIVSHFATLNVEFFISLYLVSFFRPSNIVWFILCKMPRFSSKKFISYENCRKWHAINKWLSNQSIQ